MADNYCNCCGDGTPEYIIELNQQGAPGKRGEKGDEGYSPVVDFIADNDEIRFSSTNENNVTYTPNLYDFLAKKDLSNVDNLSKIANIDDTTTSNITVWSSNKTNSEITTVANEIVEVQGDVASLDALISTMNNTIATLTARIEALEAEINGGNA